METAVYEREVVGGDAYSSKYSNLIFFSLFLEQTQFVAVQIYIINALRIDCGYSRNQLYLTWSYLVTLIILFSNFYIKSYRNKNNNKDNPSEKNNSELKKSE